jgi:hypothetical protein
MSLGEGSEQTLDAAWSIPAVDVGSLDSLEVLLGGIVAAVVIAVIVIPLFLFGIELIVAGLVVAASIVARSIFGRPWIVLATRARIQPGPLPGRSRGGGARRD